VLRTRVGGWVCSVVESPAIVWWGVLGGFYLITFYFFFTFYFIDPNDYSYIY